MDSLIVEYGVIIMIVMMWFFAVLIGIHKMLQIIVSSSFVMLMVLWRSTWLNWIAHIVGQDSSFSLWWLSHADISYAIASADITTSVLLTIGMLVYVVHYSRYTTPWSDAIIQSRVSQLLFAPFAILSMILCLVVAIFWWEIFVIDFLISMMELYGRDSILYTLISLLPLGFFIQGLITVFLIFPPERRTVVTTYDDI